MPLSWRNLKSICATCHAKGVALPISFDRTAKIQEKYRQDPYRLEPDKFIDLLFPEGSSHDYMIRLNDYPYDLEKGIEHWVLWVKPESEFELGPRLDYRLKRSVDLYFDPGTYVYFRNSPSYRTNSPIPHYHILVKKWH